MKIQFPDSQFILETHSESMLLRLQKRIRSGHLSADKVSILYVEPIEASDSEINDQLKSPKNWNHVSQINLDDAGDVIDPFPQSFAALRLEDLL